MRLVGGLEKLWLIGVYSILFLNAKALLISHETFQEYVAPGLSQNSNIIQDISSLRSISQSLKGYMKNNPLHEEQNSAGNPKTPSIYDIITQTAESFDELRDILIQFDDIITPGLLEEYPGLDIWAKQAKALQEIQKAKVIIFKMLTATTNVKVDFWKLTPVPEGSPDLVVWKALENVIISLNPEAVDPIALVMKWLGYTYEPNIEGTSGNWRIDSKKAGFRIQVLKSIEESIMKSIEDWLVHWVLFLDEVENTPIDPYIPENLKEKMVNIIVNKFFLVIARYTEGMQKLREYLVDFNEHVTELIHAIPEESDRED